jgi:hypothetical protein
LGEQAEPPIAIIGRRDLDATGVAAADDHRVEGSRSRSSACRSEVSPASAKRSILRQISRWFTPCALSRMLALGCSISVPWRLTRAWKSAVISSRGCLKRLADRRIALIRDDFLDLPLGFHNEQGKASMVILVA